MKSFQWLPDAPPSTIPEWFAFATVWDMTEGGGLLVLIDGTLTPVLPGQWVYKDDVGNVGITTDSHMMDMMAMAARGRK